MSCLIGIWTYIRKADGYYVAIMQQQLKGLENEKNKCESKSSETKGVTNWPAKVTVWTDLRQYLPKKMPTVRTKKGGWCKCFQADEPPEITYCVVENSGTLTLQAITPTQPMPPQDELDAKFAELVEELDLTAPNKNAMLNFPSEKKWQIYCSKKNPIDTGLINDTQPPEYYIDLLTTIQGLPLSSETNEDQTSQGNETYQIKQRTKQVDGLKTALRTSANSFVIRFIELDGLKTLLTFLENMDYVIAESTIHTSLIGCLKALMNNSTGRAHVLSDEKHINTIAQSLTTDSIKTKIAILEILGAVCLVTDGHTKILNAMDHYRKYAFERVRFQGIVNDLDRTTGKYRDEVNLKTAIMSFINAILNYGPGEDFLEFRLHLRLEFLRLGIQPVIEKLRKYENETLNRHLDFFDMVRNEDEREFSRKFDLVATINPEDLTGMFDIIRKRLSHTPAYEHLLSIFHHFLLLPLSHYSYYEHWFLFDRIVQQIVLQQNDELDSLVHDPDVAPIEINVRDIVKELVSEQELVAAQKKADSLEKENQDIMYKLAKKEQELDVRIQEKEDLETSLFRLKERLEKELAIHLETKQKLNELQNMAADLDKQVTNERGERCRLQRIVNINSTTTDDEKIENLENRHILCNAKPPSILPPPPPPPGPPPLLSNGHLTVAASATRTDAVRKNIPQPSNALKSFNWSKLPETKLHGTIWNELDETKMYSLIELDIIDTMFSAYQKNGMINEGSTEDLRPTGAKNKNKILSVIDGRRAQNCTILLSKLKMSDDEISRAILSMDSGEQLPIDMVEQLLKFTPNPEEITLLEEHNDEIDSLARADRFLYEISKITHYEQRLKCLHYKKRFNTALSEIAPRITNVMEASKEISRSRKLKKILEVVLALGNYMNRGARGNASGFKLCSLNRLIDTKSSSIKGATLLHYLVKILEKKFRDVLKLEDDLVHVKEAAKISLGELEREMSQLRSGLKEIAREIEFHRSQNTIVDYDRFAPVMRDFQTSASTNLSELEDRFQDMKVRFDRAGRLFGEDSSSIQPDDFFGIFDTFLINFAEARQDFENQRKRQEEDEKRARQEADLRKLTMERKNQRQQKLFSSITKTISSSLKSASTNGRQEINGYGIGGDNRNASNGEKGEFDDLISALRTGDVFGDDIAKMKRARKRSGSNMSLHRENSRERVL